MKPVSVTRGRTYVILDNGEAEVLLLDGRPIWGDCIEHGPHGESFHTCPRVLDLLSSFVA